MVSSSGSQRLSQNLASSASSTSSSLSSDKGRRHSSISGRKDSPPSPPAAYHGQRRSSRRLSSTVGSMMALALILAIAVISSSTSFSSPVLLVHASDIPAATTPIIAVTADDRLAADAVNAAHAAAGEVFGGGGGGGNGRGDGDLSRSEQEALEAREVEEQAWMSVGSMVRDAARADAAATATATDSFLHLKSASDKRDERRRPSSFSSPSSSLPPPLECKTSRRRRLLDLLSFLHSPPLPPLLAPIPFLFRLAASILAAPFALCVALDVVAYLVARGLGLRFRDIRLPKSPAELEVDAEPIEERNERKQQQHGAEEAATKGIKHDAIEQLDEMKRMDGDEQGARSTSRQMRHFGTLSNRSTSRSLFSTGRQSADASQRTDSNLDLNQDIDASSPPIYNVLPTPSPSTSTTTSYGFSPTPSPPERLHSERTLPKFSRESSQGSGLAEEGEGLLPSEYSSTDEDEGDEVAFSSGTNLVNEPEHLLPSSGSGSDSAMSSSLLGLQLERHAMVTPTPALNTRIGGSADPGETGVTPGSRDTGAGLNNDDDEDEDDDGQQGGNTVRRDTIRPGDLREQQHLVAGVELGPPVRA